jgi:type II secretory ATPase GspE/PulE/Tfp pilus assembly ATPase PilB-like protein
LGWFKKEPKIVEPPIKFIADHQIPELDPNIYLQARLTVANVLTARAESMVVTLTQQGTTVHYVIDGVAHEATKVDAQAGANMIGVFKVYAGVDPTKRVPSAQGKFEIAYLRRKYKAELSSELTRVAERVTLRFEGGGPPPERLEDAGMRTKMYEQLHAILGQHCFVLISAPPKHGFTSTFNATIRAIDRYLRNVVAVEDATKNEKQIENAPVTPYDPSQGESPATVLPALIRTYPDVICVRNLVNAETVDLLSDQPKKERTIVGGVAALDAVEAVLRVLAMKANREKFVSALGAVLNQRLVRKLCETCKEQYAAPPQLLKQLGVPPGKITAFYRQGPPPAPPPEQQKKGQEQAPLVCPNCNGIGYRGRTGIFELLVLNDALRKAFMSTNKLDVLRAEAKKQGHNSLLEEGVVTAAKGVTSIQELMRVLKGA